MVERARQFKKRETGSKSCNSSKKKTRSKVEQNEGKIKANHNEKKSESKLNAIPNSICPNEMQVAHLEHRTKYIL